MLPLRLPKAELVLFRASPDMSLDYFNATLAICHKNSPGDSYSPATDADHKSASTYHCYVAILDPNG